MSKTKQTTMLFFQFDLYKTTEIARPGVFNSGETETIQKTTWNSSVFAPLLQKFNQSNESNSYLTLEDKTNNLTILLEDFKDDEEFIYGKFILFEYGRVAPLRNAATFTQRENPKTIQEGEEDYVHFLIRKKDGLLLLQYNQKLGRSKLLSFFTENFKTEIENQEYFGFNICSLIALDFFKEINSLDSIKGTKIEVSSKVASDENEFIQSVQEEMESIESNMLQLYFKARYKNKSLRDVIPFVNKYKDKKGVTSIKVVGEQNGIEKTLNMNSSAEKIKPRIDIDKNGNILSEKLYTASTDGIKNRKLLNRK